MEFRSPRTGAISPHLPGTRVGDTAGERVLSRGPCRGLRRAFRLYLAPALVARLARDISALGLGGERREVTVMFADLSGFTAVSEQVSAEVLMQTTNQYLGYIVEQVEATGGYVDKFMGDAVLALWGAPLRDAQHAI